MKITVINLWEAGYICIDTEETEEHKINILKKKGLPTKHVLDLTYKEAEYLYNELKKAMTNYTLCEDSVKEYFSKRNK